MLAISCVRGAWAWVGVGREAANGSLRFVYMLTHNTVALKTSSHLHRATIDDNRRQRPKLEFGYTSFTITNTKKSWWFMQNYLGSTNQWRVRSRDTHSWEWYNNNIAKNYSLSCLRCVCVWVFEYNCMQSICVTQHNTHTHVWVRLAHPTWCVLWFWMRCRWVFVNRTC